MAAERGSGDRQGVTAVPATCGLGAGAEAKQRLGWFPGMMGRVTLPPAVHLPHAAGHLHRWVCGAGHTQPGDNFSGTMSPSVLCYPAPLALCVGVCQSTECFSSAVRASKLPAPKALVILQLVTQSFHRPSFPRTLKSVSSDTVDSLDPSMLNPEPEVLCQLLSTANVQLCTGSPGRCLCFRPHNSYSHSGFLSVITGSQDI